MGVDRRPFGIASEEFEAVVALIVGLLVVIECAWLFEWKFVDE